MEMSKAGLPDSTQDPPPYAPPSYYDSTGKGEPAPSAAYIAPVTVQPASVVTTVVPLGPDPMELTCPFCQARVSSSTKSVPSMKAYLIGAILCFIGCDCGCCFIPCCMESCMDVEHQCPNCNKFLGKYSAA